MASTSRSTSKSRSRRIRPQHMSPRYNPGRKRHKRWESVISRPGLTVEDRHVALSSFLVAGTPMELPSFPETLFRRLQTRGVPAHLLLEITTRDGDPRSDLGTTHRPGPELIQTNASSRLPPAPRPAGSLRQGGSRYCYGTRRQRER